MEFEERKFQMELETLRFEQTTDRLAGEGGEVSLTGIPVLFSKE